MINTLYLPELREMLEEGNAQELREFCAALHPARTAEFMEGLSPAEAWRVLQHADPPLRQEVFRYFARDTQIAIIETQDRKAMAAFVAELAPDDRVDVLQGVEENIVDELMPLLPVDERRNILRLQAYPEGVAGAVMTTDAAKLTESLTVNEALHELARQAEHLETVNYLYIVDDEDHLRGVVSARQLVSAMGRLETRLDELMESDLVSCHVMDDQEEVAQKVAKYNLLAIPVVDDERRMLGIITHDDVIDVMLEEATEDAHRIAGVDPLDYGYLQTHFLTLSWKRGIWLTVLFFAALLTALALRHYHQHLNEWVWLAWFLPLVISSGGNTGSQTATLVITALATGDIKLSDWARVVGRELLMGLLLGSFLGLIGFFAALAVVPEPDHGVITALIIPITLILVAVCGTLSGSLLPLAFKRLGLDPAMMSNPFVAGIIDILGIVIYINVAVALMQLR